MKKTAVGIAIALCVLMLLSSFATVSAGQKVTALFEAIPKSQANPDGVTTEGGTLLTSESGIFHVFGAHRFGKCFLTIDGVKYEGRVDVNVNYILDPNRMTTTQHYLKMRMIFLASKNVGLLEGDSTFEGVNKWSVSITGFVIGADGKPIMTGIVPSTMDMHGLLHGSGDFEGYILHLDVGTASWVEIR